jgi:hypothetical protein
VVNPHGCAAPGEAPVVVTDFRSLPGAAGAAAPGSYSTNGAAEADPAMARKQIAAIGRVNIIVVPFSAGTAFAASYSSVLPPRRFQP